jgi:hypothetical protein
VVAVKALKKVPHDWFKEGPQKGLSEIYGGGQDMPNFGIVAASGAQIGPWMRCKDYIQDTIWGGRKKQSYEIYGWTYKAGKDKRPSTRWLILALKWTSKASKMPEYLDNVRRTVDRLEKHLKIPLCARTHFSDVMDDKFIVWGSPHWMRCVGTVSFFTFLLRAALFNTSGRFEDIPSQKKWPVGNDAYYAKDGALFIDLLMKEGFEAFESDWDGYTSVGAVHNNGFVGFSHRNRDKLGAKQKKSAT